MSNAVTLNVGFPPQIVIQPMNQVVAINGTATFTASARGYPQPEVQWQVETPGAKGFTNLVGQTSPTLTVALVARSQSRTRYRAVFTNSLGSVFSKVVTLMVKAPLASSLAARPAGRRA